MQFALDKVVDRFYAVIDIAIAVVIVDFKAEYIINSQWELIASVTNLLNEKTYSYILEQTFPLSKALTSYAIRPRNMMLSVFFKF